MRGFGRGGWGGLGIWGSDGVELSAEDMILNYWR